MLNETVNLSEYILKPRDERVAHIDVSSPCECLVIKRPANQKLLRRLCDLHGIANDVPNRTLARIHVCHLCPNPLCCNPLHAYLGTARENYLDVPADARSEALREGQAKRTPEEKSEAGRRGQAKRTPEQRSEAARRAQASRTPEQRSEAARKAQSTRTPEQRSEASRKGQQTLTPEERSEIAKKRQAAKGPEQRGNKPVRLTEIDTGKVMTFGSIIEAAESLDIFQSNLSRVCNGTRKSTGGYYAEFV